jgi:hypothetical protein
MISVSKGVVSLYDLLEFEAKIFIDVGSLLREMEMQFASSLKWMMAS